MILKSMDEVSTVLGQALAGNGLVLDEKEIDPAFFRLKTRIAGELFQKVVNYNAKLALVVTDPGKYGNSFQALVFEHRNHSQIRFFTCHDTANKWLLETDIKGIT